VKLHKEELDVSYQYSRQKEHTDRLLAFCTVLFTWEDSVGMAHSQLTKQARYATKDEEVAYIMRQAALKS
jgi:hypothetical protein